MSEGDGLRVGGGNAAEREFRSGVERVGYDHRGRLVFTVSPSAPCAGTVVFASSLFAEFQRNYRREVVVARACADAGLASIRFHYRGVGNSIVDDPPSIASMTDDLLEVADQATAPVVFVGTRLGALAVAKARATLDRPAILIEPVLNGSRWVEEVIRAGLAREISQGSEVTADDFRHRWADNGVAFVLGETVPAAVVDEVGGFVLADIMEGSTPVHLVQLGRNDRTRPDVGRFLETLHERGIPCEATPLVARQSWWVNEGGDIFRPIEADPATLAIVDVIRSVGGGQ